MSLFNELSEVVPETLLPPLDRSDAYVAEHGLLSRSEDPFFRRAHWRENGYLILGGFLPDALVDAYVDRRIREAKTDDNLRPGYSSNTPYMWVDEIKDLCLYPPLVAILNDLVGEPMGLHLNLTGWVSTERNFHQDDYLNPAFVNNHYLAVWMALADISPDSGPFEYVPGSHTWPLIRRERVLARMREQDRTNPAWPKLSEDFVSQALDEERERQGLTTKRFIARRGDVLIWSGRLMHRGTLPAVPGTERRVLISHYSGINHRHDMPRYELWHTGGIFFIHNEAEAERERARYEATMAGGAGAEMATHEGRSV